MNHDSTELLKTIHDGDSGRRARVALSLCSDASGEVVAQANIHGVTTVLHALVEGLPLPGGGQLPATALVGRLTTTEVHEAFQITEHGVRILTPADAAWPSALDDLGARRPLALWVHGDADLLGRDNAITLTGARNASTYGAHMASVLTHDLAQRGHVFVSGSGFGIDTAVHRAALSAPAPSVAVLPCGVDRPHPAANAALFGDVRERGLVLSEYPPTTPPSRSRHARAGRLAAALTTATVIVEAITPSTSVSIAHEALRLGRPVGAVPGPANSQQSAGCHRLIQQGETRLITSADDVEAMIGEPDE